MCDRSVVTKNAGMCEEVQRTPVECAPRTLDKYDIEKGHCGRMRKEFDKKCKPSWHCIMGRDFSGYATRETKRSTFYLGQEAVLLFGPG